MLGNAAKGSSISIVGVGAGSDTILLSGGSAAITAGGSTNFFVQGGTGTVLFQGGDGKSTIDGSTGSDTIIGGRGEETVRGGTGADVFQFFATTKGGFAAINDFSTPDDTLRLTGYSSSQVTFDTNPGSGDIGITLSDGTRIVFGNSTNLGLTAATIASKISFS